MHISGGREESSRDDDGEEMHRNMHLHVERIVLSEKRRRKRKKERKEKREARGSWMFLRDWSNVGYRGRMLVRRVGELFRKQARPSPSSNGRESISGPSPVERKELLPTGQDLCPTYI